MQHKLYNGKVLLDFDEDRHFYSINGKKIDGVTSILGIINKPALMYWAVNQALAHVDRNIRPGISYDEIQLKKILAEAKTAHKMKSGEAALIGKNVHLLIQQWVEADAKRIKFYENK